MFTKYNNKTPKNNLSFHLSSLDERERRKEEERGGERGGNTHKCQSLELCPH